MQQGQACSHDEQTSQEITCQIDAGDLSQKPGWVRISMHPTATDDEARFIANAVSQIVENIQEWKLDYQFDAGLGDYLPLREEVSPVISLADF